MSAFVGLIHDGKAFLWSDAATCDVDGILLSVGRKTIGLPGERLALTGRGAAGLLPFAIEHFISEGVTADALASDAEAIFHKLDRCLAPLLQGAQYERCDFALAGLYETYDLAVAGWSEAKGGAFLCHWLHEHGKEGVLRWETDGMSAPALHPQEVPMFIALGVTNPFDPERYGRHYMAALRNRPWMMVNEVEHPGHYRIGGHVLQTTVGREGVAQAELLEWDDAIGERIDPFGMKRPDNIVPFGGRRRRAKEVSDGVLRDV